MVEHIRRQQQAGNLQPERAGCILQFGRLLERIAFRIPLRVDRLFATAYRFIGHGERTRSIAIRVVIRGWHWR